MLAGGPGGSVPGSLRQHGARYVSRLLNVGCGATCHPAWLNVDAAPLSRDVLALDVRKGLPLADQSCDAVYSSHVLEHLRRDEASALLRDMKRVLQPGGVLRVVVPDLETIAREYLRLLEAVRQGAGNEADYDWIMLELYDQAVRDQSGGGMGRVLAAGALTNRGYVTSRIGEDALAPQRRRSMAEQLRLLPWQRLVSEARSRLAGWLAALAAGHAGKAAYAEGVFRRSGEIHRWMYDAFSLGRELGAAGFARIARCTAFESRIPGFSGYLLDVDPQGRVRKPDSLFMEAQCPS
jgi:SAM-dependent methyltransferase